MSRRAMLVLGVILALAVFTWHSQLFTVSAPGVGSAPLRSIATHERVSWTGDVVLPVIPVGMQRLSPFEGVMVIHYWAPWEQGSLEQAAQLDSLRHVETLAGLRVWLVTFDPFPSVARYIGRNRLSVPVLLDGQRELRKVLPCPSIPFTYVIDAYGRIAVEQRGRVDWHAPETRAVLAELMDDPGPGTRPVRQPD